MIKTITKFVTLTLFALNLQMAVAQTPFVTEWNLATPGSGNTQLSFAIYTAGPVSYKWATIPISISGIGTLTGYNASITGLPVGAKISLSIDGTNFYSLKMYNGLDKSRLTNVAQWGSITWLSFNGAFLGCDNLQISANDLPNLASCGSMNFAFQDCINLNSPTNIGSWNTTAITSMSKMFSGASSFNQPLTNWNTASVTDMSSMFASASTFNQPLDQWNISSVNTMQNMFANAISFNQNLGAWGAKFQSLVNLTSFLDNSNLSSSNFEATLQGFIATSATGIKFGANGLNYCSSSARNNLTAASSLGGKGWTIIGDNLDCSSASTVSVTGLFSSASLTSTSSAIMISLTGTGFLSGATVTVGGIVLTNVTVTGNLIKGTIPVGSNLTNPSKPSITVQNPNQKASVAISFEPTILTSIDKEDINFEAGKLISIFPNPTSGIITVENTPEGVTINIFTIQGRLVLSQITDTSDPQINVSLLTKGVYIVKIGSKALKLIKN
jgi:surface protein